MLKFVSLARMSNAKLFLLATISRLFIAALMHAASYFIEDYDSGALLYSTIHEGNTALIVPLAHWDAVHFHHIAKYGYTHEHIHAFFPGVPMMIRYMGSMGASLAIMVCFGGAVVALRALTVSAASFPFGIGDGKNVDLFVGCAVFMMLTGPATVFTAAMYTEAPFALCSFLGMLLAQKRNEVLAAIMFALATTIRSNGILLSGFFIFPIVIGRQVHGGGAIKDRFHPIALLRRALCVLITIAPYLAVNYVAFQTFCVGAKAEGCPEHWTGFYAYIQKKYWNVGWFTYYTFNNIPNFFIAAPLHLTVAASLILAIRRNGYSLFSIGEWLKSPQVPYLLAMLALALTRMHVQVVTRFVLGCPALYWLGANLMVSSTIGRRLLMVYCVAWIVLGVVMFSNFLPWT